MFLPKYFHFIVASVLVLLASVLNHYAVFRALDLELFDSVHHIYTPPVSDDIIIVDIDEQSLELFGSWPWSRGVHADLLNKLASLGVEHVAFDVIFSEVNQQDIEGDIAFAKAISEHGKVVLPLFMGQLRHNSVPLEVAPAQPFYSAASAIGHVHIDCDLDAICRSVYLKEGVGQPYWPHISLALFSLSDKVLLMPGERSPVEGELSPQLIYRDFHNYILFPESRHHFKTISYADVVNGIYSSSQHTSSQFKGATVFIGASAAGLGDEISTPVGTMPGVVANAIIYQHLRHNSLVRELSPGVSTFLIASIGLISLLLLSRLTPMYFLFGTLLALMASYTAMALLTVSVYVWFPVATLMLLFLAYYPLWSWFKLQLALNFLRRQLNQLNIEQHKSEAFFASAPDTKGVSSLSHGVEVVTDTLKRLDRVNTIVEQQRFMIDSTLEHLSEALVLARENGTVVIANTAAQKWLAIKPGDQLSRLGETLELENQSLYPDWQAYLKSISSDASPSGVELRRRWNLQDDSENLLLYCRATEVFFSADTADVVSVKVMTFTDITMLKESERSRLDMVNFLSHDLRSPMVSVLALITNIQFGRNSDSIETNLEKIKAYAEKNLGYSESILQLSRAEGISKENFDYVDAHAVIDSAYCSMTDYAASRQMNMSIERDDNDIWVYGDVELLDRAVQNLLSNAIKYSHRGGRVVLTLTASSDHVLIQILDSGPGIDAKSMEVIFEKYRRGETDQKASGAGLGLFFVRTVAKKHGGSINVDCAPDQGACFTLTLPRVTIEPSEE